MEVETRFGNIYSYDKQTGEIVIGRNSGVDISWNFEPLEEFNILNNVDSYILSVTEQCNLRCTYCCYSGIYLNKREHSQVSMNCNDVDEIYNYIKKHTLKKPVRLFFYGGEPLLYYNLIKYAVNKAREIWNENILFTISTNGTTLTKDRIDWIVSNNICLAVSIDGTKQFHDRFRVDKTGKGSFNKVYESLLYIRQNYPEYFKKIIIIMTLASIENIVSIAKLWHEDPLLSQLTPTMMNSLAPNFAKGIERANYDDIKEFYNQVIDAYELHPEWVILRRFLDLCIANWKERPIMSVDKVVPMATCLPHNSKLYIDTHLQIGVCEKISDKCRIGSIKNGIDMKKANSLVRNYYNKRSKRCKNCDAVRMCNMCLTAAEYTDEQWNILCHNERVYLRAFMYVFCEMAERGLIK